MKNKQKVSIVVPVYNVENYISRCINSLIKQSYKNLEIVLVDDGSTDSSGNICDEYKKIDSRIKVIHKKNGGLSDARNFGIDGCTGEYICFVDSDDWIEKEMIETLLNDIIDTDSDIAICGRYRAYDNEEKIVEKYKKYPNKNIFNNIDGLQYLMSFCGYDMSVCDKMFKKDLFSKIRFPYGLTCEDSFTTYKLFSLANKICYINKPFYNYFFRTNSITRNGNVNETVIIAAQEQYKFILENYPNLKNCASSFLITAYMSVFNEYIKREKKCLKISSFKKEAKKYLKYALKNDNICFMKKMQMSIFCFSSFIYKIIYKKKMKGYK